MTQFIESHTIEEMVKSITSYLPGGDLFIAAQISGTNQNDLLRGIGLTLLDAENFIQVYNSEFIPDNTNAFIEEWESALGIPDSCFPGPEESDLSERRLHILVKLASLGVQTVDDFVNLAVILGFPDTEVIPGVDFGVTPIEDARFTIVVRFPVDTDNLFDLDFPIPFGTDQYAILECLFSKLKPANCTLQFEFIVPLPLLELSLISDTEITIGTGSSTYSRSSDGSFIDKADNRIKIAANNVARFENDRYLSEGASENLILRSKEFDNAAWTKPNATITIDDKTAPNGTKTADKMVSDNSTTFHQVLQIPAIGADNDPATYTLFGNSAEWDYCRLRLRKKDATLIDQVFNINNGTLGTSSGSGFTSNIKSLGNGWYQCIVIVADMLTGANTPACWIFETDTDVISSVAGDGISGIHISDAQFEVLPFPTSLINTTTVAVPRSADSLSVPATSNIPAPGDDHSISFTIDALGIGILQTIYNVAGETTRRANINAAGNLEVYNGDLHTYSLSTVVDTDSKIVITFSGTTEKVYQDGALISSNTKTIATGTATAIWIGSSDGSTDPLYGHLQQFKTFDSELDLAEIQGLS